MRLASSGVPPLFVVACMAPLRMQQKHSASTHDCYRTCMPFARMCCLLVIGTAQLRIGLWHPRLQPELCIGQMSRGSTSLPRPADRRRFRYGVHLHGVRIVSRRVELGVVEHDCVGAASAVPHRPDRSGPRSGGGCQRSAWDVAADDFATASEEGDVEAMGLSVAAESARADR